MRPLRHSWLSVPILLSCLFWPVPASQSDAPDAEAVPLARYLAYARAAADWTWEHRDELLESWKDSFDPRSPFGYRPPGGLLEMAVIDAHFYEKEKKPVYAERAKHILLSYRDHRTRFPEWARRLRPDYEQPGVPVLPDFFTVMRFIRAFDTLRRLDALTPKEAVHLETDISESMDYVLQTQEWGPMNRAVLRAESLAWALRALPGHPKAGSWEMQRRALGDDNWGNWQIEDATIYHGVWLYALLGYADALGRREELLRTPEMTYYARYFLRLMAPSGMVPDFGDAWWNGNWNRFLVFFEAAAAHHRDPELKWAAATIVRRFLDLENPRNIGLAYNLLDCARWGADDIPSRRPTAPSGEVLEDVVGKKIVFRSGWRPDSTYLLLNYRDEGDGGLNFRDYLRDTIPVEEEKMTHGHADENSIVLLMSGGSVLLHDAGYRDFMPSGPFGAYRQDYFHNRLCFRPRKIFFGQKEGQWRYSRREAVPGQGVLEFFRDSGAYRRVRTQKVDFLALDDFDYSRTRLVDDNWGGQWDRVTVYVKDPEMFVIFDIFKSLREEFFTLASLWHTRQVLARGENWFETAYDRIQSEALSPARRLLLLFPLTHYRPLAVEPQRRHSQEEWTISQTTAQHFELGQTAVLAAVLMPHNADADLDSLATRVVKASAEGNVAGLTLSAEGREIIVAAKIDPRRDMIRDWRRPKYTYESGRIEFAGFETDGDFLFASRRDSRLAYTIVNLTRALFEGRPLCEAGTSYYGLAFDGSPDRGGRGRLRYWRDEADLSPKE